MPSPDQERLDVISSALASILHTQRELERRLTRIESTLDLPVLPVAQTEAPAQPVVLTAPAEPDLAEMPPPLPQQPALEQEAPPKPTGQLETSIGLTLINRIGVITLVLGLAFFFKWAVDNQWIGPAGRVELGILAALLAIAAGDFLWRRGQAVFAQGVIAVGVALLYLAIYAAFGFYHLVPQAFAFAAMFVTTAMAAALSLRYGAVTIAALGFLGGYLTPLLLSTGEDHPWFLFSYVLLLDVAAMGLARLRSWRTLELLSAAGTISLYGGWLEQFRPVKQLPAVFFALLFYALYATGTSLKPLFLVAQFLTALAIMIVCHATLGWFYLLAILIAAGGLAVADRRRWPSAASVAFASFWLLAALNNADAAHWQRTAICFLGLTCGFVMFLAWIPWRLVVRRETPQTQDLVVLALNGAAYFGASYWLLDSGYHVWMGLFAVALAGVHVALGYELWRRQPSEQRELRPILLTVGVALTLLTLAAPIQLTAYRITMAWALEGAALSWIGSRLKNARMIVSSAVVFFLVLVRLASIDSLLYIPAASSTFINSRFLTFAIASACLWLGAKWIEKPESLPLVYYGAGHVVLLWGLTLETLGWAGRVAAPENLVSVETISVSILYALYALILVSLGVATRTVVNRIAGLGLIGIVVLKLYLFDVWQIGRLYRTLAFVALGILLLSTSFLYSHFRSLIESWWKHDQAQS